MIFVDAQPSATLVDYTIGEAQSAFYRAFRRERLRIGPGSQRVKPLIGEMREVEDVIRYCPRSSTVFVNSGARIERRGEDISGAMADNHAATGFPRTRFEPVYVVTVEADFRESDGLGDNQVRSNWR